MSWPTRPYTISNALLSVDPSESGLVGGWNMRPQGDTIIDLSPYGNDGANTGARYEKTPLGDALVFDGVDDTVVFGNAASLHLANALTFSCWVKANSWGTHTIVGAKTLLASFATGWGMESFGGNLRFFINNWNVDFASTTVPLVGTWNHIVGTFDKDAASNQINLYVNGVLKDSATRTAAITAPAGDNLQLGEGYGSLFFDGSIVKPLHFTGAKDQTWVTREYQKGRTALFKTDWGVTESIAAVASGPLEGSPFIVDSGTFKMSMATIEGDPSGIQLLTDGDMEAVGVAAWTTGGGTVLTKDATAPHGGSQWLKVSKAGTGYGTANQITLVVGKSYNITGWARGDGTRAPFVYDTGAASLWTGTSSTAWQAIDVNFVAVGARVDLGSFFPTAGFVGFDDVSVELIPPNVKVIECVTAGVCYIPTSYFQQTPTEAAFGTWEWWMYSATGNNTSVIFVSEAIGGLGTGDSYDVTHLAAGDIDLGEEGIPLISGGSFAKDTWHHYKVTRKNDYEFELFINGVSQGTGSDLSNLTSKYLCLGLRIGDKMAYADPKGKHNVVKKLLSI